MQGCDHAGVIFWRPLPAVLGANEPKVPWATAHFGDMSKGRNDVWQDSRKLHDEESAGCARLPGCCAQSSKAVDSKERAAHWCAGDGEEAQSRTCMLGAWHLYQRSMHCTWLRVPMPLAMAPQSTSSIVTRRSATSMPAACRSTTLQFFLCNSHVHRSITPCSCTQIHSVALSQLFKQDDAYQTRRGNLTKRDIEGHQV